MQRPAPRQQNFFPIASPHLHDQDSSGSATAVETTFNNQRPGAAGAIPSTRAPFSCDWQRPVEMGCDGDTPEPVAPLFKQCKSVRRAIPRFHASPANANVRPNRHPGKSRLQRARFCFSPGKGPTASAFYAKFRVISDGWRVSGRATRKSDLIK